MSVFVHQLGFALAVAALWGASVRLAARTGAHGLMLVLAASAVSATAVVLEWLALGLVGLGGSAAAAVVAALATWVAVSALAPPRPVAAASALAELRGWMHVQRRASVLASFALAGAALAFVAWCLRYPPIGADGLLYHLPESLAWLHGPRPGSVVQSFYGLPVGNYPLVGEVLQGWGFCLSRSFAPATLLMAWSLALLVIGGWVALRTLEVPPLPRGLAIAAIAAGPLALGVANYPSTDLSATAWLVVCGALVAGAVRGQPALLGPALLAGGLAAGTKTTALPLTMIVLALGLVALRAELRLLARPLLWAGGAAAIVGGFWYARNLVEHGSPFWPLVAAPWGDPVPTVVTRFSESLLDRPGYTLTGNLDEYAQSLAGAVVLLGGIVVGPLLARTRAVLAAAGVAALSVLIWANAPLTGRSSDPVFASVAPGTTRYLLPGLCAAALVTALAARRRDLGGWIATAALATAAAWSLLETASQGAPTVPSIGTLAVGALVAVALAAAAQAVGARGADAPAAEHASAPRRSAGWTAAAARAAFALAAIVVAALALEPAADGYVGRFARVVPEYAAPLAAFAAQPNYARTNAKVSMAPVLVAPLAGDRLQHQLELMPADITCADVEQRVRTGWVVIVSSVSQFSTGVYFNAGRCLAGREPTFRSGRFTVYGGAAG